jgi:hypothetical protein
MQKGEAIISLGGNKMKTLQYTASLFLAAAIAAGVSLFVYLAYQELTIRLAQVVVK